MLMMMFSISQCPSWQTLCLLLALYLCPAIAGSVLEAKGLPEPIVPPKPKVNEPEWSNPWGGSTWKGGTFSEPMDYTPASAVSPADDVNRPLVSNPEHYKELAENVLDLLNSFVPAASSTTASQSTSTLVSAPAIMTSATPISEAALGCSIFSSYMSLCTPTPAPSSHPGSAPASQATDALASCACYSATYYVPDALDSAASACAAYTSIYTSAPNSALVPLATSAAQMEGFCALCNVRNYPSAQFGQVMPTASSGSSSPRDSTTPSNDGGKLGTAMMSLCAALFANVLLLW